VTARDKWSNICIFRLSLHQFRPAFNPKFGGATPFLHANASAPLTDTIDRPAPAILARTGLRAAPLLGRSRNRIAAGAARPLAIKMRG
jgi:hypothetical protein